MSSHNLINVLPHKWGRLWKGNFTWGLWRNIKFPLCKFAHGLIPKFMHRLGNETSLHTVR